MNRPYVQINVAMTVDGKIDTFERRGAAISSALDKERVDLLRAASDAVMVGGKTLLAEGPKLTVRSAVLRAARERRGQPPNPAKVGAASCVEFKSPSDFLDAGPARILLFTTRQTDPSQIEWLRSRGVEVFVHNGQQVDLASMLESLKSAGIQRLLVEGGGTLNFELLRLGFVDELTVYVAPLIFGGAAAPTLADGPGLMRQAALHLTLGEIEKCGEDGIVLHYHMKQAGEISTAERPI